MLLVFSLLFLVLLAYGVIATLALLRHVPRSNADWIYY